MAGNLVRDWIVLIADANAHGCPSSSDALHTSSSRHSVVSGSPGFGYGVVPRDEITDRTRAADGAVGHLVASAVESRWRFPMSTLSPPPISDWFRA